MEVKAYITKIIDGEGFFSFTPFEKTAVLEDKQVTEVAVRIDDGRHISNNQLRKIHAIFNDITKHIKAPTGNQWRKADKETESELLLLYHLQHEDKEYIRRKATLHYCKLVDIAPFSLSNIDMTTASDFIDWLIELCITNDIPSFDNSFLQLCEDITRYLYACAFNRRCAICGQHADVHHHERIGMGRNRKEINHVGMKIQPLCRIHHNEAHQTGQQTFDNKYHIGWIKLDEELCNKLGLNNGG